jgi:hypothetical protein
MNRERVTWPPGLDELRRISASREIASADGQRQLGILLRGT